MSGLQKTAATLLQTSARTSKCAFRHVQPCAASAVSSRRHNSDLTAYARGRGGRSSFNGIVATVFGASGFLGRYVVNQLGKMGTQVVVAYRGTEYDVDHLKLCGDLGQILFCPFYLRDENSVRKAMKYSNVVINLMGREWETKNFKYEDVHVTGAELVARLAAEQGVQRLVHLSALNASKPQPTAFGKTSRFVLSKGKGEEAVRSHFPDAIIMRPSDMWGEEDRFFNYWASRFRRHFDCLPVWQGGQNTIKQPVDVVNVAQGIIKVITDKDAPGNTYECVGPKSYYQCDMLDYFYDEMRFGQLIKLPLLPSFLAKAYLLEAAFPATPILIGDKLIREADSDRLTGHPTLEDLGVQLNSLENAARFHLKWHRQARDYSESLNEIMSAPEPPTSQEVDESRRVYY